MKVSRPPGIVLALAAAVGISVAAWGILSVYPMTRTLSSLQKRVARETQQLKQIETLYPTAARTSALTGIQFIGGLPLPERISMERPDLVSLPVQLKAAAIRCGLVLSGSEFDLNAMADDSRTLLLTLALSGDLQGFRQLLQMAIAHPSFHGVDSVEIAPGEGLVRRFQLTLRFKIQKGDT
ncbi:MAG: hypothetical protein MI802_19880 [Desulfobacterales bacterium]|nr:hypothetical protein [Desulfobacterales bacterium]